MIDEQHAFGLSESAHDQPFGHQGGSEVSQGIGLTLGLEYQISTRATLPVVTTKHNMISHINHTISKT